MRFVTFSWLLVPFVALGALLVHRIYGSKSMHVEIGPLVFWLLRIKMIPSRNEQLIKMKGQLPSNGVFFSKGSI